MLSSVPLRCLIVDDSERFLEAARGSLDGGELEIVGTAATGADALEAVESLRPDVVLLDIGLGQESGFEVARSLAQQHPWLGSRIVLISTHAEEDFADMIESSPAVGFLQKSRLSARAVRGLVDGDAGLG